MVVRIPLDEPITQCYELKRGLIKIESDALSRKRIVFILYSVIILANLQVIGVSVRIGIQINENGLISLLRIK